MDWTEKQALVTGGGGFIGSHLVSRLIELGASVRALVKYNSRNDWGLLEVIPDVMEKVEVITGDLRDPYTVQRAVEGVQVVFHLGAIIAIPFSYQNPYEVVETNVMGTLNMLSAARDSSVEKFIHTSTSEVYGTARYAPIDEKHPLQAQSPYSASKIAADKLAESFFDTYSVPVGTVRPFNTYGPRQSARAVIPTIISQVLTRDEIKLGSLHPTRDLNYVGDTVSGFIKAAESPDILGETVNLGTGKEISIGQLAERIFHLIGKEPRIQTDDTRIRPAKSEVERLIADNSKAKLLIGW